MKVRFVANFCMKCGGNQLDLSFLQEEALDCFLAEKCTFSLQQSNSFSTIACSGESLEPSY